MNDAILYGTIVVVGTITTMGILVWLRRCDKKANMPSIKKESNFFVPKIEPANTTAAIRREEYSRIPLYQIPDDLDIIIPVGSKSAVICEWDKNKKPTRAAFRAKGGHGKIVTAIVVRMDGMMLFLRHKMAEPMFQRPLVG